MGILVVNGAQCMCSFGMAPSALTVLPDKMTNGQNMPVANIMDNKPMVNIMPFGMCQSMANPAVASATAAAMGVLTPQPCTPMTASPWAPGSPTVLVKGQPALNNSCKLMCSYGGVLSVTYPGQNTVMVP